MKKDKLERIIYTTLKVGAIASGILLTTGVIMEIFFTGFSSTAYTVMTIGIFVLFATPITGVGTSVFVFAFERNKLYTIITTVVFIDIMVAIFIVPRFLYII